MAPQTIEQDSLAPLRPKHRRFVEEYLVDLNATKAAVRAGYARSSAHVTSCRLLARADVRQRVEAALEEQFGITKMSIIEELAAIAFHDIADYMSWTDKAIHITPSDQLTEWQRKAIASVRKAGRDPGCFELKLNDKLRALELLARVLGLFDQSKWDGPVGAVTFVIETPVS